MRKMAALFLAAALATPAFGQSFVGSWIATAHLDGGIESLERLSVGRTDSGYSIAGKPVDPTPGGIEAGPGIDIVIEGDRFSYKRKLTFDGNELVITYEGTVSGDAFTGTAEVGGTRIPYTGERVPGGK